ncbi:MAG TPA: winged helix-turn-helix domain-containing protein [Blastocatellia bacterium]|nr:winged helix-turn-helix domain-containing protein [Blastocatellia bacterium]
MSASIKCVYEFNGFRLDPAERLLLHAGTPMALPPKAFDLLVVLVSNQGRLLTKDELMRAVWADAIVELNNLDKNIYVLRKALSEDETGRKFIETVRGHGYRFTATVTELETEPEVAAAHAAENGPSVPATLPLPDGGRQGRRWFLWLRQHQGALLAAALLLLAIAVSLGLLLFSRQSEETPREIKVTRLTNGGEVLSASLSPDGKYFVYAEHDGSVARLWLRQVAGGQPLEIVTGAEPIVGTTFAPDGQFVYYVTLGQREPQGALYRVPTLGGAAAKLLTGIASPVAFAPDGRRLAFVRLSSENEESSLVIAESEGGNARTVLVRNGGERLNTNGPAWSPDGQEIACSLLHASAKTGSRTWSLISVNVQSGGFRTLTAQQWDGCGRVAWLGDGRGLVLIGTRQGESGTTARDQVWYVSPADGAVRRITTELNRHDYNSLSVTQDGQALLILPYTQTSQVWAVKVNHQARYNARDAVQLTTGTSGGQSGLVSLADGHVVYVARTGDHIGLWQISASGGQPKQLTTEPPFLEELAAPSDGRFFVFASNRAGASHLFRVERDGTNLRQLTQGDSFEADSDCSPDGRWVVYSSHPIVPDKLEKDKLWKIPAEGGASVRLTESEGRTPRFSPDGKWISYVYAEDSRRSKVAVISADGGAPVKTFDVLDGAVLNSGCRWMPDGQALTYIVTNKRVSNLWAQPLNGGAPYSLTDFNSGQIYNYAFARDGQHLLFARGYPTSDALLLKNFR